jgi:hypothetical protein
MANFWTNCPVEVIEYKEFESIGWSARELGGVGYHG